MPSPEAPAPDAAAAPSPISAGDADVRGVYVRSLTSTIGGALVAGLAIALIDLIVALGRSSDVSAGDLGAITLGLYAVPSLFIGVVVGGVTGAWRSTFGDKSLMRIHRRLRNDADLDTRVCAGILAGLCVALVFAGFAALASMKLVANVQRASVGAILLGAVLAMSLPLLASFALPMYRITLRIAPFVPRIKPLTRSIFPLVFGASLGIVGGLFVVFTKLDWRALNLGFYLFSAGFVTIFALWFLLWQGPLARVGARIPRRGAIVLGATFLALLLPFLTLQGDPDESTAIALSDNTTGARFFANVGRSTFDGDGDGFSAFLGGPDCDDSNAAVHPGAKEIPDNGIDDNCIGGDRKTAHTANTANTANTPPKTPPFAGNVLFIMIDTLRADRLGVAGYQRDGQSLTPNIDALAQRSTYFTRVYSPAPNTPRVVPSMFTSRFPSQVKVDKHFKNFSKVLDDNVLLFEVLQKAKLYTVGYASHFYFKPERNVHQGFDLFDNEGAKNIRDSNKDIAAPRIVPKAISKLKELAASKQHFAMFVHLFEPHSTYVVHDGDKITEHGIPSLEQKYDYEIRFTDRWVGTLLDSLKDNGLQDDTIVVLLSDHGEAFGVHRFAGQRMFFHGQTLYDELLKVPMIVHVPGTKPQVIEQVVSLLDVTPTLLDLLGLVPADLELAPAPFMGRSLAPAIHGEPLAPAPAFGQLLPAPSWRHTAASMVSSDGRYHLIFVSSERRWELYDLRNDPKERKNLFNKDKELTDKLKRQMVEWIEVVLQN